MKKHTKQFALLFAVVFTVAAVCSALCGCEVKKPIESGLTLPTQGTSSTSSTSSSSSSSSSSTSQTTSSTTGTTPIIPSGTYVNPLTGLKTLNFDPSVTRPVAIVVDNISNAYATQKGLSQADIIYETLVAPGITRYLAVIQDYENATEICNIRSGRDYHISLALGHNAILVCHGGSITSNYDFYSLAADKLGSRWGFVDTCYEPMFSWKDYTDVYGTRVSAANRGDLGYFNTIAYGTVLKLVTSSTKVGSKFVANKGTAVGTPVGFTFAASGYADMVNAQTAQKVKVNFTCDGKAGTKFVEFQYNPSTEQYVRYQDNRYTDVGETLSFTNLLILGTTVKNASGTTADPDMALVTTTGFGEGYYVTSGRAVKITWKKMSDSSPLKIYVGNTELALSCGKTYVGYVEASSIAGGLITG